MTFVAGETLNRYINLFENEMIVNWYEFVMGISE